MDNGLHLMLIQKDNLQSARRKSNFWFLKLTTMATKKKETSPLSCMTDLSLMIISEEKRKKEGKDRQQGGQNM